MRKSALIGSALAIAFTATVVGYGIGANAQSYGYGPGMMYGWGQGPGMMHGWGHGPGMMYGSGYGPGMMYGPGYGPGMMGPGWQSSQGALNISPDDAKNYFERWIATQGNARLKVGEVKAKDADTIIVDIVTKDNSLVQRFIVNRRNGFYRPGEG